MVKPFRPPLLHDHLDGSRALLPVLPELFRLSGKPFPFSRANYRLEVKRLFRNSRVDIVTRFSNTTGVMQSPETLALAAYAYTASRARDGYPYCEATIAPQYHTYGGLTPEEVVAALIEGIKRGESEFPQIETNLIFAVGRESDPEEAVKLVEAAARCDRDFVVGIGLVCDEATWPPGPHVPMFRRAKALGFKKTAHAGEWVNIPPMEPDPERDMPVLLENIWTAVLDLEVDRVGHAIPLAYDPELVSRVISNGIGVEWCPGSNLTSGLIPNTDYLRIKELLSAEVLGSINPDDDLFMPDMDETLAICDSERKFTEAELDQLYANAWKTRFGRRKPAVHR